MATAASQTDSLTDRVFRVIAESDHLQGRDHVARQPRLAAGDHLGEFELDLRDWGFAYGVAFALAHIDSHPFDSPSEAAEQAYQAAFAAWARYADGFRPRPNVDELTGDVVRAFQKGSVESELALHTANRELADALITLSNTLGTPGAR